MLSRSIACFMVFISLFAFVGVSQSHADVREAMVKVFTTTNEYNFLYPWQGGTTEKLTGSGAIISGSRVLTNAHVVANQTFIQVQRHGSPQKYTAKLIAVSHDADLALLTVDDLEFFEGVKPLEFSKLPDLKDNVTVYGYPTGGESLSITAGVVSRIEEVEYVQSKLDLLGIQLDAAINSGNSGGPALLDGKIVGVAMQGLDGAENIGYIIPTPIISHFLKDLEDGNYDGFPENGMYVQNLDNPGLRKYLGLGEDGTGILVARVLADSPSDGIIRPGDVLIAVDGHKISSNNSIELRKGLRVNSDYFTKKHQVGETVIFTVIRDHQEIDLSVQLTLKWGDHRLVKFPQYDRSPPYVMFGGAVFTSLSSDYMKGYGDNFRAEAPLYFLRYYFSDSAVAGEEAVILSDVLTSRMNVGYGDYEGLRVLTVNNQQIKSLSDIASIIDSDLRQDIIVQLEKGYIVYLNREDHNGLKSEIMKRHGMASERSVGFNVSKESVGSK